MVRPADGESQATWLTLDASGPCTEAALVRGGALVRVVRDDVPEGRPARLANLVAGLLATRRVDALAVIVGPGSFTGLRAAIALAHGLADAGGPEAIPVTVGEAVFALDPTSPGVALPAGAGRMVTERGCPASVFALVDAVPTSLVWDPRSAPLGIARAAALRRAGVWAARLLQPVYAVPPAAIAGTGRSEPR